MRLMTLMTARLFGCLCTHCHDASLAGWRVAVCVCVCACACVGGKRVCGGSVCVYVYTVE